MGGFPCPTAVIAGAWAQQGVALTSYSYGVNLAAVHFTEVPAGDAQSISEGGLMSTLQLRH